VLQLVSPIPELDHESQQRAPLFYALGLAKRGKASPGGISEISDVIHCLNHRKSLMTVH
jgi:hypothetical protein